MATVTTREQLKDYCLRRLGAPVIEINIDDDQIEDRIDDAFQFYMFSIRYQILINDLYSLMSTNLIYYYQVKQELELINQVLVGTKPIRFNRHMNRLYVDMDWGADANVGDYIIVECYRILDPDTYRDVYNDRFLKQYTTALFKRQWGENLKKFSGVQLPGGVTLNADKIYEDALDEINKIEAEMQSRFELPVDMFTG